MLRILLTLHLTPKRPHVGGRDSHAAPRLSTEDSSFSSDKEGWWNAADELADISSFLAAIGCGW